MDTRLHKCLTAWLKQPVTVLDTIPPDVLEGARKLNDYLCQETCGKQQKAVK